MTSNIFKCSFCNYNSNKKFNLNRHMMSKHNNIDYNTNDTIHNNVMNIDNKNDTIHNNVMNIDNKNDTIHNIIMNIDKNVMNDKECEKCNKIFSSKQYLNKHLLICKGVSNPLECHFCHKILANRGSKSTHLKICKEKEISKELIIIEKEDNELILNDNSHQIINNNITNNNITNNNITYNINLVSYNIEDRKIKFDVSHLNKNNFYKLTSMHKNDAFSYYYNKLFENKNNQMIIKSNLRHNYSKVHTGFNIWQKILDENIYHIIMHFISESLLAYIYDYVITRDNIIKELIEYTEIMSSNGYKSDMSYIYQKYYNNNIKALKILFNSFIDD